VDVPLEARDELAPAARAAGLCLIPLAAPTTSPERAAGVLRGAEGFVYYIMFKGVTGVRTAAADDVEQHVAALRDLTDLPIAVGFGVSDGARARQLGAHADAVVVGSALVRAAREDRLAPLVRELAAALKQGRD
jgi:tryptophan synthase alpha chain